MRHASSTYTRSETTTQHNNKPQRSATRTLARPRPRHRKARTTRELHRTVLAGRHRKQSPDGHEQGGVAVGGVEEALVGGDSIGDVMVCLVLLRYGTSSYLLGK